MSRRVDPDRWRRDIAQGERKLQHVSRAEERRRDGVERWFNRVALMALIVLYIVGFVSSDHQRSELAKVVEAQKSNRVAVSKTFCRQLNQEQATLRGMIVAGAVQSKPFEDLYRSHGSPPYAERVKQAHKTAAKLAPLDCKAALRSIERDIAHPPPPKLKKTRPPAKRSRQR